MVEFLTIAWFVSGIIGLAEIIRTTSGGLPRHDATFVWLAILGPFMFVAFLCSMYEIAVERAIKEEKDV